MYRYIYGMVFYFLQTWNPVHGRQFFFYVEPRSKEAKTGDLHPQTKHCEMYTNEMYIDT